MKRPLLSNRRSLIRRQDGVAAIEFALAIPLLIVGVIGITQLGILFFANAGLGNAVAEGARFATTYDIATNAPPTDAQILQRITDRRWGLEQQYIQAPTIARGTDANGNRIATISMNYALPLNFVFFTAGPVTLTETRRAYLYAPGT